MNKKDKEFLLKDLCAKLPYGVICLLEGVKEPQRLTKIDINDFGKVSFFFSWKENKGHKNEYVCSFEQVKPYLRPMSSMTEEEEKWQYYYRNDIMYDGAVEVYMNRYIDWLDSNHFDWRMDGNNKTLIERGLAKPAPKGMYK